MAKRQRRLGDVDTVVLSLYAKGLTTGEISEHFAGVTDASLSEDRVIEEMTDWCSPPLLAVYAAGFIDAIYVKVRDGQVSNRPFYAAIGVHLQGRRDRRDVLGLWAGSTGHGESSKYRMSVLAELKNGGVQDVFFIVCDGLKGLPDSANAVFPLAIVQTCSIHLVRGTFRYASRKYWDLMARDMRPIYTAARRRRPGSRSRNSRRNGPSRTQQSPGCGGTLGNSSHRFWTTTSKSDGCCARQTRSSR